MRRPILALVVILGLLLPIIFMAAFVALADEQSDPSQRALKEIPAELLPFYRAAATTCSGLDWTILAAIHRVETNFGVGRAVSSKGAQGPMQFMPATWSAYGVDGNGDGIAEINDVADAIFSAARLLCANGAGDRARLADAIWNYNHSDAYVTEVLGLAMSYGVLSVAGSIGDADPGRFLADGRVLLTANARADVEAGVVDPRLLILLETVARRHPIGVSVFKSGHSMRTASGSISNHFYGRGADIFFVAGDAVSRSNLSARDVVAIAAEMPRRLRPSEIGHPFADLDVLGGFTDAAHADHIHLGFD